MANCCAIDKLCTLNRFLKFCHIVCMWTWNWDGNIAEKSCLACWWRSWLCIQQGASGILCGLPPWEGLLGTRSKLDSGPYSHGLPSFIWILYLSHICIFSTELSLHPSPKSWKKTDIRETCSIFNSYAVVSNAFSQLYPPKLGKSRFEESGFGVPALPLTSLATSLSS